jgi:hypothetical protein
MAKVKIQGHASGTGVLTVTAPNTSTDRTITLPDATGTLATTADTGVAGITSAADATAITIDSSEQVGIANTSPNSYDAEAKNLVVGSGTGHQGITIVAGTSSKSKIHFADGTGSAAYQGMLHYDHSNDRFTMATATADRIKIDSDGIKFGSDTAAANALDDYEEGTWTAGYSGATASGGQFTGYYIRIGRVCHYQYYSGAMTFSSITGTGTITGLPFTSSNLGYAAGTFVHGDAWGDSDGLHVGLNDTNIYCVTAGATTYRDFVAGSKYLMITGTYIIKEGS